MSSVVRVVKNAFSIELTVTTVIDRPATQVWAVLVDTDRWREWNPFVTEFVGKLVPGVRVAVTLQLPGRKAYQMRPRVVEVNENRSFAWLGSLGFRGVFDGRHHFEVRPVSLQTCELIQHERLGGALVPMFRSMITGPTASAFVALNEACKERVEVDA